MKLVYRRVSPHKGVIIYHDTYSGEIEKYLLADINSNISIVDPSTINLNVSILILFFKNIFKIKKNLPFKKFIFLVYQYSVIESLDPKVVLTFIDNSLIFQWLSKNYQKADFYAIQNGSRSRYELHYQYYYNFKNNFTNFFCFGDYERSKYKEYGHNVKKFIPSGSFRLNVFKLNSLENQNIKYDFSLVSQHKPSTFDGTNFKLKENLETIDMYFSRYLKSNNKLTCLILCRSKKGSAQGKSEYEYFKYVYGDGVDLRFQDEMDFSTYVGVGQSDIVVGCHSTVMIEAAGMKKKVLFCDYSKDKIWADYPDGVWLHTENNYTSFKERIDNIRLLSLSDYSEFYNYIISSNNNTSTIDIIKREIYSKLNEI